ncbi:MAG: AAA family ATPase [Xenococcaceae cyanobacterium MO_207.B15]|nr:AAA family ATPase [Xenococcaceae cyanobacterium MO_207.B15]
MRIFKDYKLINKIYVGSYYQIYRAIYQHGDSIGLANLGGYRRQSEATSVLIKIINPQFSNLEAAAWLRNEYQILERLTQSKPDSPIIGGVPSTLSGIIKPYRLEKYKNSLALVLEDFAGEYLDRFLETKKLSIDNFFTVAIQIVNILQKLHHHQIIHKNIKPSSIVIHPETLEVKITDFSIATNAVRENISSEQLKASNIAYISPEQTGRMNLPLDYRTDFYSLGIVFYQMLTGKLPYQAQDSLQLMYCHLAQTPVSPHQLNSDISETVSSIVMKLLAKNPEDRYQSAYGIKEDLETCQIQYQIQGRIEPFDIGTLDKCSQFIISPKLYGRSSAVNSLTSSLERVFAGAVEMVVVSGNSGMGKTTVITEVTEPIVRQKGYFIAGKFEQFNSNIPYEAIIQAFRSLVLQLLIETSDRIQIWQEKILSLVGINAKVITDILPELELIIGSQPDIPQLPPQETENRFNTVFEQFVRVFAHQEYPLVLFLDDLQWADSASLKLLDLLLSSSNSQYLLIITAYRDNEVNSNHPLIHTINKIQQNISVSNIVLQPLTLDDVNQLLVDTLHCQEEKSLSLAKLLVERTGGNPFFINQLLQALYQEKLVTFDFNSWIWCWQMEEIRATSISNYNVLELVARNIEKLPHTSQQVLKLAACIGSQFDLAVLAKSCNQSQDEIAKELENILRAGIILLVEEQPNPAYKFLHDRIQQTTYSLLDEAEKIQTHLKIGRFLLQRTTPANIEEKIFNIVNHLNIGRKLLTQGSFQNHLAELNLIAGKKAKNAFAYKVAANYLDIALELLPLSAWKDNYNFMFNVHIEAVEVQYLQTNFDRAEKLANVVISLSKTLLEKVKIYAIKIHAYIAQDQMQLAIDTGLSILELLKVSLPNNPRQDKALRTQLNLEYDHLKCLETLPKMTDGNSIAAMEILAKITPAVYIVIPQLFPLLVLKMIDLCLQYGNSRLSAYAYALYGLLLCTSGNIDAGYQLGKLALRLQEQFDAPEIKPKVSFIFNNMIRHWKEPAISTLEHFLEGIQNGIEVGDIEHACFHAKYYCTYIFFVGESLASANEKSLKQIEMIQNFKQDFQLNYARIWRQLNLNLQGLGENKFLLIGESFDESKMLPFWQATNNATSLLAFYVAKLILCYFLKDYQQAIVNARKGKQYLEAAVGTMCFTVYHFYASLAMLAVYPEQSGIKSTYLQEIVSYQQLLKQWATHAPDNHLYKYELVTAEIARVLGKNQQASEHYDKAITEAAKAGYMHEAALAEELTGEFYLSRGKTKIAGYYLTDAYYGYWRWGALAKVQDLESKYSELITRIPTSELTATNTQEITIPNQSESLAKLDLFSVIKASQAISSEIILDNLLSKMMEIVMENAGARKSILLLQQNSSWMIAASARINPDIEVDVVHIPIAEYLDLPNSIINYIQSTRNTVILEQASNQGIFTEDPYIVEHQPKSILAYPMIYQNELQGIIYLENSLVSGAFTQKKLEILQVLLSQVSISIENARLYKNLENHASVQKSLKQKEILLKEIHHRVKNNLLVVSSLLELQSSYIEHQPEVIKILENCQNRITSMALVHKHLYGNTELDRINLAQYIKSLLDNLAYSQASQERNIDFVLDLENIELNIETANPCGLIINELVSNALEHGFIERDRGNIWLSLKHNLERKIVLIIQDDGVGFKEDLDLYNSDSLGLELVCSLVEQLNGTINLDKTSGTKIEIIFDELDYESRI